MSQRITIELDFYGLPIEVTGTHYPAEPMVMYYKDGSGYPGSPEEFELEKVTMPLCPQADIQSLLDAVVVEHRRIVDGKCISTHEDCEDVIERMVIELLAEK